MTLRGVFDQKKGKKNFGQLKTSLKFYSIILPEHGKIC